MEQAFLKLVHVAGVIVWVGGMVFAHFFLRPAAQELAPPQRLPLMLGVLQRFFATVLVAMPLVLASGVWLMLPAARARTAPMAWTVMAAIGIGMGLIFLVIRFVFYPRLQRAVALGQWPDGGAAMVQIRRWVGLNLTLGVATVAMATLRWPN